MSKVTIYHNPRCSKSRQTLEIIKQQGIEPHIVQYLKEPMNASLLRDLLKMLEMDAYQLLRVQEDEYKQHSLSVDSSEEKILEAMVLSPKLIERPIVVSDDKACIGRPPENVLNIL